MKVCCIACEVFYRELCLIVARSVNKVDLRFIPKGLHDLKSSEMRKRLQEEVDRASEGDYEKIALGYALCNHGVAGIKARTVELVIPRAHDCITLFLGSRERFYQYFREKPGTYFLTSGWVERGSVSEDLAEFSIQRKTGLDLSYENLRERYGEENARYIMERLGGGLKYYRRFTYIDTGTDPVGIFEGKAAGEAKKRGWEFEKLRGDLRLLSRLVNGPWEEDFLLVPPGFAPVPTYDQAIIKAVPEEEVPKEFCT